MKKIILLLFIATLLWSCSGVSWEETKEENTIEAYQQFIEKNPDSEFLNEAKEELEVLLIEEDEQDWKNAENTDTETAYQEYIDKHENGIYIDQAKKNLEKANDKEIWKEYQSKNTVVEYYNFTQEYPYNIYYGEAKYEINILLKENFDTDFKEVIEFFIIADENSDFSAIDQYIEDNIIFIENSEEWDGRIDTSYVVDSISYVATSIAYVIQDLKTVYEAGGFSSMVYDEYNDEYFETDLEEYVLDYIPEGVIFYFIGDCAQYYLTFIYRNQKLYLSKVYIYQEYCDV